jgi:hypothetical protein
MATTNDQTTSGNVDAGSVGQGVSLDQVQAVVLAAMAGITTSLNEITNKVNSLETRVKESTANDDTNFETSVTGVDDPFEDKRRSAVSRDRIQIYAEQALAMSTQALANAVELSHRAGLQGIDHAAALPPLAPRSATGPGVQAS